MSGSPFVCFLFRGLYVFRIRTFAFLTVCLLMTACQSLSPLPTLAPAETLPVTDSTQSSPVATPTAAEISVLTGQSDVPSKIRFEIDRPVKAQDTVVKGSGPKGISIVLLDATHMGVELGATTIGEDGRFTINVQPLPGNIRIGIQLAEHDDAIWADKSLLGPDALVLPLVGAFVDTVLVVP